MNGELLWSLSRATGVVSTALLTGVLVLGCVLSGRRRPEGASATIAMSLHRTLSLGLVAFLLVHIVTAVADGYVDMSWLSAVVPFTSGYETLWVGLGTLAVDLLVAVVATSLLRHRIPEGAWRAVHWGSYGLWPLALVHGFAMGTADEPLLRYSTLACGAVGVTAMAWRLLHTTADHERRRLVSTQEWM